MNTLFTQAEVEAFKNSGFKSQKETIIKRSEVVSDVAQLAQATTLDDVPFKTTPSSTVTVFNVLDYHDNFLLMDIESEKVLIYQVRRLLSAVM